MLIFSTNKLGFGIIVTGIPLAIVIEAVMGWGWYSFGGILATTERPDHQIRPLTLISATIETRGRTDLLVNPGVRENPDFASLPFAMLRLQVTNYSKNTHNITVAETNLCI